MAWSLVVDDVSIALLVGIVLLLAISIYTATSLYQPQVHPLLLSRQADVSPVRRKGESAIYRNANMPSGFDLASQPRKAINTVTDVVVLGSGAASWSKDFKRDLYGDKRSNQDVVAGAQAFGRGLCAGNFHPNVDASQGTSSLKVGVSVEVDSLESLQVTLSGDAQQKKDRFAPMIIAPAYLKAGQSPNDLADTSASSSKLHALFTTPTTLKRAADLSAISIIDESTLLIFANAEEVEEAQKIAPRYKATTFEQVVGRGKQESVASDQTSSKDESSAVHSIFWSGADGWIPVSNASLIAGLSSHLASFPAEAHPTKADRIFIEQSPYIASPSLRLGAGVTPAGLVLALLALYTGAALAAGVLSSSHSDPNPTVSREMEEFQPTLIYASPAGSSSLAACLCTYTKRSPLAFFAAHGKLVGLRRGVLDRSSIWDRLLFNHTRKYTATTQLRLVAIIGEGPTISQGLLDVMRAQLGCAIRSMYLPTTTLRAEKSLEKTNKLSAALPTAPIAATHSYDLQAFASHAYDNKQLPAHVGPPSVAVEMKLVETLALQKSALGAIGIKGKDAHLDAGRANDPIGEIFVRGTSIAHHHASTQQWFATGDFGVFRSNGTLVVIRDAANSEEVDVPTLSAEYPTMRRTSRLGAGGASTRNVPVAS